MSNRKPAKFVLALLLSIVAATSAADSPARPDPKQWAGMKAPDFRLAGSDGSTHSVDSLVARGPFVLVWFPKAYTGNTDRLLKSIDGAATTLASHGVSVVAASCDKTKYLQPYARTLDLKIPILADPTRTTAIRWGTVGTGREIPRRWAYFIDRNGKIAAVRTDLDAASAGSKIAATARALGWTD